MGIRLNKLIGEGANFEKEIQKKVERKCRQALASRIVTSLSDAWTACSPKTCKCERMNKIIMRSQNIVRAVKLEKKVYGMRIDSVYDLLTQARTNRENLEAILDRQDMRTMSF